MVHILVFDMVCNPGMHNRPPDVVSCYADIQDGEQRSRRHDTADPEYNRSCVAAEDKRIKDMDNVPGDPFLGERPGGLCAVGVEQIRKDMDGNTDKAPESDMT
ncbi:hypothetical protein D3C80_1668180 [compost metagenome]